MKRGWEARRCTQCLPPTQLVSRHVDVEIVEPLIHQGIPQSSSVVAPILLHRGFRDSPHLAGNGSSSHFRVKLALWALWGVVFPYPRSRYWGSPAAKTLGARRP